MMSISQLIAAEQKKHAYLDQQIRKLKTTSSEHSIKTEWDNIDRLITTRKLFQHYTNLHKLNDWCLKLDNACERCGLTNYSNKTIQLSKQYINNKTTTKKQVINTILHEIAHALTPGQSHNQVWKKKALEIGCDGKVCNDISPFSKAKWILTCNNRCFESNRHRRSNVQNKCCKQCKKEVFFIKT